MLFLKKRLTSPVYVALYLSKLTFSSTVNVFFSYFSNPFAVSLATFARLTLNSNPDSVWSLMGSSCSIRISKNLGKRWNSRGFEALGRFTRRNVIGSAARILHFSPPDGTEIDSAAPYLILKIWNGSFFFQHFSGVHFGGNNCFKSTM